MTDSWICAGLTHGHKDNWQQFQHRTRWKEFFFCIKQDTRFLPNLCMPKKILRFQICMKNFALRGGGGIAMSTTASNQ